MQKTKVWAAKKGTKSLRTTVPEIVAEVFQLKAGDEIGWVVKTGKIVELRKV